ncbi:DUF1345 domain-containing protein [Kaistia geumhonensis]|uniref:Membrane protein n=1 Tax=Kaistia geumhonensis TaxID=410839 RepID=A0ABU0M507_9HYPH|nr:DUF1345 domain-containing protein [Kaistia geumhonensis]MCX5478738.1 DUF1345 domain-containing protein [Kaistia geumhonensis]MDQ0516044.1 putative membrane protein [Kaistia geumhonensis]
MAPFDAKLAPVAAGDVFFAVYFAALLTMAFHADIKRLRARARTEDEGIMIIMALTLGAIMFSFFSIFAMLGEKGSPPPFHLATALVSIPLGWSVLNALFAFHYARLYYAPVGEGEQKDSGGLDFPGDEEPRIWDFWYFSFVIGATFQTSDVGVKTTDYRVVVLFHSIASFVFNTVLLALAVNIGASFAQ